MDICPQVLVHLQIWIHPCTGTLFPTNKQSRQGYGPICCTDTTNLLSVINLSSYKLSSYKLSSAEIQILSRGLAFCPEQNFVIFEAITDIQLFARRLLLKYLHAKNDPHEDTTDWSLYSMWEFKALQHLTLLYQENNMVDLIDQIDLDTLLRDVESPPRNPFILFKKASTKFPPANTNPNVKIFLQQAIWDICKIPRTKCNPHNFSPDENETLKLLRKKIPQSS